MDQRAEQDLDEVMPVSGVSECLLKLCIPSSIIVVLVVGREGLFCFVLFLFSVYRFPEQEELFPLGKV